MEQWLINLSTQHTYWIYAFIVIVACAEGPFLSIVFGALIKLGFFDFLPIYLALMGGDLIGDVVWYLIGRYWGHPFVKRFGKYFSITEEAIEKVTKIFHKYQHSILLISKLTTGFGFAIVTLMTAGLVRIPFGKYITLNILGQFVWTGLLIGVGYFVGNLYSQVSSVFGYISVTALVVIFIGAFIGYGRYMKNKAKNLKI